MTNFKTRIQNKIDSLAAWNAANPILLSGEIVVVTGCNSGDVFDTRLKIGDGVSNFQTLPFLDDSCFDLLAELYEKVNAAVVVYVGSGVPANDIGSDNDIYI